MFKILLHGDFFQKHYPSIPYRVQFRLFVKVQQHRRYYTDGRIVWLWRRRRDWVRRRQTSPPTHRQCSWSPAPSWTASCAELVPTSSLHPSSCPLCCHTHKQCDAHASHFYRAMLCIRGTGHGPVSVRLCPSVTSRCSIETAERIELVLACELPSTCPTLY